MTPFPILGTRCRPTGPKRRQPAPEPIVESHQYMSQRKEVQRGGRHVALEAAHSRLALVLPPRHGTGGCSISCATPSAVSSIGATPDADHAPTVLKRPSAEGGESSFRLE